MSVSISETIYNLPKKDLKKWIALMESVPQSEDLSLELEKLKGKMDAEGTGRKSKKD
jgi:hypothetical protein